MKPLSVYPWDMRSWKIAFRQAGLSGAAMIMLLLADFVQIPDTPGQLTVHASKTTLWLVRGPLVLCAALIIGFLPRFARLSMRDLRFWFLVFTVYFAASLVWSYSPVATMGKALELVAGLLIVMQASRDEKAEERLYGLFRLILLLVSTMVTATVIGFLLRIDIFVSTQPNIFMGTSATSPFLSANGVGYASSCLILVCFTEWQFATVRSRRLMWQVVFASTLFLFAGSRTSFAIIVIGVLVVLLRKSKTALLSVAATLGLCGYFFGKAVIRAFSYNQAQGNLDTLSGRTVMWAAGFREWTHSPLIGFGGGEGGKHVLSRIGISSLEQMSSMHSGFMETLDGLGLIGFLIGAGILVVVTYRAYQAWKARAKYISLYVLVVHFWITSLMSLGVLGWMNYELALYLVLLALIDVERRKKYAVPFRYGAMIPAVPEFGWSRASKARVR
jgi:O-antigen ligase